MKIISFLGLLAILFFYSCSNDKPKITEKDGVVYVQNSEKGLWHHSKKMVATKIWTIGEDNEDERVTFARITAIAVNKFGDVFLCDDVDNCIRVFDKKGKYIRMFGKNGQGPGELATPVLIGFGDGKVFVDELGNRRISVFNASGEYLLNFSFHPLTIVDMQVDRKSGDIFFTKNYMPDEEKCNHIYQYSGSGKLIHSFGKPCVSGVTGLGVWYSFSKLVQSANGNLICSNNYPYEVKIYDRTGRLKIVFRKHSSLFKKPKIYKRGDFEMPMAQASVSDCFPFPNGNILLRITDYGDDVVEQYKKRRELIKQGERISMKYKTYYDLFDAEGNYLQTFDDIFSGEYLLYIDRNGYAYTISKNSDFPKLSKYSIKFKEKSDN